MQMLFACFANSTSTILRAMVASLRCFVPIYTLIQFVFPQISHASTAGPTKCRCIPGDACWPREKEWGQLNATVEGRLIKTVLSGLPCHQPYYNATECAALQADWDEPQAHFSTSADFMAGYFQNQSCDPYTPESKPCTLGNYVDYAINVGSAADVAAGLQFAQEKNIRLVIKNTGHDYLGKSTGAYALGIWTHNLKTIEFLSYRSTHYTGPAIKMGAGVQAFEAYAAANTQGLRVVGGECPTVGIAGGYTQGGGHSVLASVYGLGADQALEWEVVTADGTLLTATPTQNSELYWALSGGGGGTYGVVLSLTAKAHADGAVGGATIDFALAEDLSDKSWNGIAAWHSALPAIVDNGIVAVYFITQSGFSMLALTAPGKSAAQVTAILSPFTTTLQKLGVPYTLNVTEFSSYYEHVSYYLGPLPYGELIASENIGGRLIPRSVIQDNNNAVTEAVYTITRNPAFDWIGIALNVSHATAGNVAGSNAVLPAWRNALIDATVTANWNFTAPLAYNHAHLNLITDTLVPLLESITPGSGSYLNEGDFQQTNYQESFYGSNYDTLLAIKNKYDPNHLFYAITAVGSEAWTAEANGRLCRTS